MNGILGVEYGWYWVYARTTLKVKGWPFTGCSCDGSGVMVTRSLEYGQCRTYQAFSWVDGEDKDDSE